MKSFFTTLLVATLSMLASFAQPLTGIKTIPGDYATLREAIAALNTNGTAAPGVTYTVAADYTEIYSISSWGQLIINTTTANSLAPILFQRGLGGTANPKIKFQGGNNSTALDGGIILAGTDYITFDGIDVEATDNTIEWGFALLKRNNTAPFNGCQHITIKNCQISLSRTNTNLSYGIYSGNHLASSSNALTITSSDDASSYCKFDNLTINNVNVGIGLNGYNAPSPYTLYDQNNEIGLNGPNTISNFGGGSYPAGIKIVYQNNINISNNTITSAVAATGNGGIWGINLGDSYQANAVVNNNSISISYVGGAYLYGIYSRYGGTGTSNTITISNNHLFNISNDSYYYTSHGIYCDYSNNAQAPGTINITNNNLHDMQAAGTHYMYAIKAYYAQNLNVNGNQVFNISKNGSGELDGIAVGGTSVTMQNNSVHDLTGYSTGLVYGIQNGGTSNTEIYNNNTTYNISNLAPNSQGVFGMYFYTSSGTRQCSNNSIYGLYSVAGTVTGMYHASSTPKIYNNTIYDLTASGTTGLVNGLTIDGGTSIYIYNNLISNLKTPEATNTNAINGILRKSSGSSVYCYNNSIYLNASSNSTSTFGTSGIFADTYNNLELKNNIIINTSTPVFATGPAYTVAFRRSSSTLTTYSTNSNNNCLYAGPPSANNLIYYDGTNADESVALFKYRVNPRESASISENPTFIDPSNGDLHLNATVPTSHESNGLRITSPIAVTTDYDNEPRWGETGYSGTGTATDIGADESNFTPQPPMTYQTSLAWQQTGNVFAGNTNQAVIRIKISVTGATSPKAITQFLLNAIGTTDITDINQNAAKIYYTGNSPNFFTNILFGSAIPTNATYVINGNLPLSQGDNYFWLAYDIRQTAATGRVIDAECTSIVIGGTTYVPTITAPIGNRMILGPMSGTYLVGIGQTAPNFTSLTQAVLNISNRGVGGPVVFQLTNDATSIYNESNGETFPIVVSEIPLTTASNTVTLKVAAGKNPIISGNSSTAVLTLNGTDYFTINGSNNEGNTQNLSIVNTNGGNNTAAVLISSGNNSNGANYNTIKNCYIKGGAASPYNNATYGISVGSTIGISGAGNDNLTLYNNTICNAYYGLCITGSGANPTDNLNIHHNVIGSANTSDYIHYMGVYLNTVSGEFSNNEITGVGPTTNSTFNCYGLYVHHAVTNMNIVKNNIHRIGLYTSTKSGTGIAVEAGSASLTNTVIANNTIYDISGLGATNIGSYGMVGIRIGNYASALKVYNNSVYLSGYIDNAGSTNDLSAALFVGSLTSQLDIRNNILVNSIENTTGVSKAYAFYCSNTPSAFTALDYNDYYTSGNEGVLAYFGSDKANLTALQAATTKDAHSIAAWPDYNSTTVLVPYAGSPVLASCPLLSVVDDYNGNPRANPASMGAFELPADLTPPVISFTPLHNTNVGNARTLHAQIDDYKGSVPTAGMGIPKLYWRINNGAWQSVNGIWIQGNQFDFTFGSGATLGQTVSYYIVAQDVTATPNIGSYPATGASGFSAYPPTCLQPPTNPFSYTIVNALSGTKTIPGDYPNLTGVNGLFADINSKVLTGPLTVNITNSLNEDGLNALNEINVTDTAYHVTLNMNLSFPRTITGNYNGALIRFNGADGVTINGNGKLSIINSSTAAAQVISFANNSNRNTIKGCKLSLGSSTSNSALSAILLTGNCSYNTFENDTIIKCYNGVYLDGVYWNQSTGNTIKNCVIGSQIASQYIYQYGIFAKYQDNLHVIGNEIFNIISNGSPIAIYAEGVTNTLIEKNNLHDIVYSGPSYGGSSGITIKSLLNNPNVVIKNNLIRKISGMGSSPNTSDANTIPAGIKLFGNTNAGIYIYNNSIYMTPDPTYGLFYNNEWFTALEIGAGVSGVTLVNNILQNSVGERTGSNLSSYGYAIYCKSTTSPFATINNNLYYTSNYDNNFVGLYGTATPPVNNLNLAAWRTFTSQDAQSLNTDPLYTSTTNLTPQPSSPSIGMGLSLPGVVDHDYLNAPRGNPSTIGAYEMLAATPKNLNITLFLEGLYAGAGLMNQAHDQNGTNWPEGVADQIRVELHNATPGFYASILYTSPYINLGTNGQAQATIPASLGGSYYITIKHRNSLETVSAYPVSFSGNSINYNFHSSANAAYGNNLKHLGGGIYGIYCGDVNQDGFTNESDAISIESNALSFSTGYITQDLNGDGIVDAIDLIMLDTNAALGKTAQKP